MLSKEFVGCEMKFLEEQMNTLRRISAEQCVCWTQNQTPGERSECDGTNINVKSLRNEIST